MSEVAIPSTTVAVPRVEPAIITTLRETLGDRLDPATGARVHRLDALGALCTPETATLVALWLYSARRASATTRRGYTDDITAWATWYQGRYGRRLDLAALSRADVTVWLAEQEAAGLRPATIARRLSALSSLYRYAASHGLPVVCPITEDHRPRVQRGRHDRSARVLTRAELRALTAACHEPRDALVVALLLTDGLRVSELCTASDTDITVERGRTWLRVTRKGGQAVRVPLDPAVVELLDAYRATRPDSDDDTQPLIRDEHGRRIDRHDVARMLRRLARAAGLDRPATVTPHALRASAITHLIEAGRPITDVQRWAGHSAVATTMVYYDAHDQGERHAAMTADLASLLTTPQHTL